MKALKLYAGVFGPAIVLPAAAATLVGIVIGSAFGKGSMGLDFGMILSALTVVGSFGTPALTILNFVKPENQFVKISAGIVMATGLIASITMINTILKSGFSITQLVLMLVSLSILASGFLQFKGKD